MATLDGFIVPGEAWKTPNLSDTFSRGTATRDPLGTLLGDNDRRFDAPVRVSNIEPWTAAISGVSDNMQVFGSGIDAAGSGIVVTFDSGTIRVHSQESGGNLAVETIFARTTVDGEFHYPIADGYGVNEIGGVLINALSSCVVAHGLIELTFRTKKKTGASTWQIAGIISLYSTDMGETWAVASDDSDDPLALNADRHRTWAKGAYYTPWARNHTPLDIWIPAVQYFAGDQGDGSERLFLNRYTRANAESAWTLAGSMRTDFPLAGSHLDETKHLHSAGMTAFVGAGGRKGLQIVLAHGDGVVARIDRLHIEGANEYDPANPTAWSADWTDDTNWTKTPDYYGRGGTNVTHYPSDQWVGVQQGAGMFDLCVSRDNDNGSFSIMTLGEGPDDDCTFRDVGPSLRDGLILGMFTDRAEMGRRVAWVMFMNLTVDYATLYSDDFGETWSEIGQQPLATGRIHTAALAGDFIYRDNVSGQQLSKRAAPVVKEFRPLCVAPGGYNDHYERSAGSSSAFGHTVHVLTRHSDGFFYDFDTTVGDQNGNAAYRLPQTPFLSNSIWRINTAAQSESGVHNIFASELIGFQPMADGALIRGARYWMLASNQDRTRGATVSQMQFRRNNAAQVNKANNKVHSREWTSQHFSYGPFDAEGSTTVRHTMTLNFTPGNISSEGVFFFAVDNVRDDRGCGYPMPPRAGAANTNPRIPCDNEDYSITGINFANNRSIRLIGSMDRNGWADDNNAHMTQEVVATLNEDAANFIELVVDYANKKFLVRGEMNDVAFTTIELGTAIRFPQMAAWDIVLSRTGTTLRATAKLNGAIYHGTATIEATGATLDNLDFANQAGTVVTDQYVLGVATLDGALDESEQAATLAGFDEFPGVPALTPAPCVPASQVDGAEAGEHRRPMFGAEPAAPYDSIRVVVSRGEDTDRITFRLFEGETEEQLALRLPGHSSGAQVTTKAELAAAMVSSELLQNVTIYDDGTGLDAELDSTVLPVQDTGDPPLESVFVFGEVGCVEERRGVKKSALRHFLLRGGK